MKKSDKKDFQKVICRQLKVANNLIDVAFRNILYFLLVIDGKQVDTRVGRFNDHIERDFTPQEWEYYIGEGVKYRRFKE